MPWFKVDDTLASHPKARAAGLPAMGMWVVAGAYASQYLTEGFVPDWYVASWPSGRKHAAALVSAGLWEVADDGWRFHQWAERQPTKEQVEADRKAARERQQRRRDAKRDGGVSHAVTNAVSHATPTRPDPTRSSSGTTSMPRKRGERLPEPWVIDEAMWDWAAEKGFAATFVNQQTERFVNYWRAKAGKDATKLDWRSTWKNWLLRAADDYRPTNGRTGQVDWDAAMARAQARDSQGGIA